MTLSDIAHLRLQNQQLTSKSFATPLQVVDWLGAVQAQDYAMAKWAIGIRLPGPSDQEIEDSINRAEIVRTHVMRPTWHFALAKDIRWMLALTAPHIKSTLKSYEAKIGLNGNIYKRTNAIIERILRGNSYQTRSEIVAELKKKKITLDNLQASFVMFDAELNGIVCNGPMRGKQFTYALMDERIAGTKALTQEEALAKLALKYFTSHGPATIHDFAWWSGLPMAKAKEALELVKAKLTTEKIETRAYWFDSSLEIDQNLKQETPLFLPAYDEFMLSYTDRSASLDPKYFKVTMVGNGIFRPIIVKNGRITGVWLRTIKKDHVLVTTKFFSTKDKLKKAEVKSLLEPYSRFLNLRIKA